MLVRAKIIAQHSRSCTVRVPTATNAELVEIPHSEIFQPDSTDQAAGAIALVAQRIETLREIVARAQAEIYELGAHALV